jgi:hypothetical protein
VPLVEEQHAPALEIALAHALLLRQVVVRGDDQEEGLVEHRRHRQPGRLDRHREHPAVQPAPGDLLEDV